MHGAVSGSAGGAGDGVGRACVAVRFDLKSIYRYRQIPTTNNDAKGRPCVAVRFDEARCDSIGRSQHEQHRGELGKTVRVRRRHGGVASAGAVRYYVDGKLVLSYEHLPAPNSGRLGFSLAGGKVIFDNLKVTRVDPAAPPVL